MVSPLGILNLFTCLFWLATIFGYLVFDTPNQWKAEVFFAFLFVLVTVAHLVLRLGLFAPLEKLFAFFVKVDNVKATPEDFQLQFQGVPQKIYIIFLKLIFSIINATIFVNKLTEGKLDAAYTGVEADDPEKYKLVAALLKLRQQTVDITARTREADWATAGFAKFVEVLRTDDTGMEELSARIVEQMTRYLGAAYGLFFDTVDREGQPWLRLVACYAHERAQLGREVAPGEGLAARLSATSTSFTSPPCPKATCPWPRVWGRPSPRRWSLCRPLSMVRCLRSLSWLHLCLSCPIS
jgi:hypothetical protein